MPLYEYRCSNCAGAFELFRRMDDHPDRCPRCSGQNTMQLQVSGSNFQLKGTGWYKTDYGKHQ